MAVADAVLRLRTIEMQVQEVLSILAPPQQEAEPTPPKGGKDDAEAEGADCVLEPHGYFRNFWHGVNFVATVVELYKVPYDFGFGLHVRGWWANFVFFLFFFDMLVKSSTSFYSNGVLVRQGDASNHYFTHLFFFDFVATLPLDWFYYDPNDSKVASLLRLVRIVSLPSTIHALGRFFRVTVDTNSYACSLVFFVVGILVYTHWTACLLGFLGEGPESYLSAEGSQYTAAINWALSLATGQGVANMQQDSEKNAQFVAMLAGVLLISVLLTRLIDSRLRDSLNSQSDDRKLAGLNGFLNRVPLPASMRASIESSAVKSLADSKGNVMTMQYEEWFNFPPDLRKKFNYFVRKLVMRKFPEAEAWALENDDVLTNAVNNATFRRVDGGAVIVQPGSRCVELIVPLSGTLHLLPNDENDGGEIPWVGEVCLEDEDKVYAATVVAACSCELLCVPGSDLRVARKKLPHSKKDNTSQRVRVPTRVRRKYEDAEELVARKMAPSPRPEPAAARKLSDRSLESQPQVSFQTPAEEEEGWGEESLGIDLGRDRQSMVELDGVNGDMMYDESSLETDSDEADEQRR